VSNNSGESNMRWKTTSNQNYDYYEIREEGLGLVFDIVLVYKSIHISTYTLYLYVY